VCSGAVVAGRPALQLQCICFGLLVRVSACHHCPKSTSFSSSSVTAGTEVQLHARDRRGTLIQVHEFQFIRVTGTVLLYEPSKHAGRRPACSSTNKQTEDTDESMIETERSRRISLLSLVLSIVITLDPYPIHRNRARPYISSACCVLFRPRLVPSPKVYILSHRMFGHMHEVLNIN